MIPLASIALAGCLTIGAGSDRVLAGDLAREVPAFAAVAPDTPLAPAPLGGAQRIFRAAELRYMALRMGLPSVPDQDVCVERRMTPLDPEKLLEIMRRQLPGASLAMLDYSRIPAPEGAIEFPLAALRPAPGGAFWSGYVVYAGARHFPIWAKIRASSTEPRVVAAASLEPGRAISAAQLRLETKEGFPTAGALAASVEEVAGKAPRRFIANGTAIRREWLEAPQEIQRGDQVLVEARAGAARLELTAVAEAPGSAGDVIPVLNPFSMRRFKARVEGKGKVSVGEGNP
ncbi:MAG: flagellar basal body P-ring formation chaperone FlgA [Bryobacteraceae bacterium]|jgi:flagella basal body P-ring formation protein FlgA